MCGEQGYTEFDWRPLTCVDVKTALWLFTQSGVGSGPTAPFSYPCCNPPPLSSASPPTQACSAIDDLPSALGRLDADTAISRHSYLAALKAAGAVCAGVDRVMAGKVGCRHCA